MSDLYRHPDEYNLEHLGDSEDVEFHVSQVRRLQPRKVLELELDTSTLVRTARCTQGCKMTSDDSE
jgi:hypothetical protein